MNSYYQTTALQDGQRELFAAAAQEQDKHVLKVFKEKKRMTASQCWQELKRRGIHFLIGSVKRSMSTLKRKELLSIEKEMAAGMYGRPEHYYTINQ